MAGDLPSELLEQAVQQMNTLPGVGRKTALRLVLNLLRRDEREVETFANAFLRLKKEIHYCRCCHNLSDTEVCPICSSRSRDRRIVCVVENVQDVMAIENTGQYNGLYHVLGGIISPMDAVGPQDIEIESLASRIETEPIREIIFALPTTMEGDTTTFYIHRRLQQVERKAQGAENEPLVFSQIARGMAIGNELEYTDEVTLGRSIVNRQMIS
ncbi:MAG: recombination protein RecR [Paludibacteraceae bacterium]|nr:recombination protein RecR [Paludibacteraceae bacterium]